MAVPTSDPWTTDVETDSPAALQFADTGAAPAQQGGVRRLAALAVGALLVVVAVVMAAEFGSSTKVSEPVRFDKVLALSRQHNVKGASTASRTLTCYVNGPDGLVMEVPVPASEFGKGKKPICVFYKYKCKENEEDSSCTAGAVQDIFIYNQAEVCDYLKGVSDDPDSVQCCNTDLCNTGDTGGTGGSKDALTNTSAAIKELTCYVDGPDGQVLEMPLPASEFGEGRKPVCVSYKYKCKKNEANRSCPAGGVTDIHTYSTANACAYLRKNSHDPDGVQCCSIDLCNQGDP